MKPSFVVVALFFVGACAGADSGTHVKSHLDVITEEEIQETKATNAYELIRLRRPQFLKPQGARGPISILNNSQSSLLPLVYVDGHRYGYPEDLSKLTAAIVKEVRYLGWQDANMLYGFGHDAGIILVTTNR